MSALNDRTILCIFKHNNVSKISHTEIKSTHKKQTAQSNLIQRSPVDFEQTKWKNKTITANTLF